MNEAEVAKPKLNEGDRAAIWAGCCALTVGAAALGAWLFWLGLLLALPLLLVGLGYATWMVLVRISDSKASQAASQAPEMTLRMSSAAHFATVTQVLRAAVAAALLLNLALIVVLISVAAVNSGYVGENYELSQTYLTSSEVALRALGSLSTLSTLGLIAGYNFTHAPEVNAGEAAALNSQVGAVRTIKFAHALDAVTRIAFTVGTFAGIGALIFNAASV